MKTEAKMTKAARRVGIDMETLADDARALLKATAHLTEDKIDHARKRLEDVLGSGGDLYDELRDRACRGARIADGAVRDHTYTVIGLAMGAGLLVGLLAFRRGVGR